MLQIWHILFIFALMTFNGLKVSGNYGYLWSDNHQSEQEYHLQIDGMADTILVESCCEEASDEANESVFRVLLGKRQAQQADRKVYLKNQFDSHACLFILFQTDTSPPSALRA